MRITVPLALICALLVTVLAKNFWGPTSDPVVHEIPSAQLPKLAGRMLDKLEIAISEYVRDNSEVPSTQQGLEALFTRPASLSLPCRWKGPYLDQNTFTLIDPWGSEFQYIAPGRDGETYVLSSLGADRRPGGFGPNADLIRRGIKRKSSYGLK